jgi:hypothetical protein
MSRLHLSSSNTHHRDETSSPAFGTHRFAFCTWTSPVDRPPERTDGIACRTSPSLSELRRRSCRRTQIRGGRSPVLGAPVRRKSVRWNWPIGFASAFPKSCFLLSPSLACRLPSSSIAFWCCSSAARCSSIIVENTAKMHECVALPFPGNDTFTYDTGTMRALKRLATLRLPVQEPPPPRQRPWLRRATEARSPS